ncbi:LppX_LprAFG lipoprotein [Actinomadura sp. HBU206391]|uniref:LppX_LprAFG lipoprotein n=1 Tax=Actinomadura sp. HBU206391 TaxID=2731692 RepID=UPI00165045C9|nr:LppX_LprAFG lipoprotein [Actinomadura sp. HBU206391]MBC6461381.1 LppX_LprAFG lipoprotein [Actinomadura sp. HBU206391]
MIRRFVAGTAVSAALALSLTGCLGEDSGGKADLGNTVNLSAAQALLKTSQKAGEITSFKADVSVESGGTGAENVKASGTAQYRLKPTLGFTMTFNQMNVGGESMAGMEQVLVDKTLYMKLPMLGEVGSGKPWVKIPLDTIGKASGLNMDQMLQQSQQMDPVQSTKQLTASKDVREVGKETIDGVQTTHFTGTYSVADATAKLEPAQQEAAKKAAQVTGLDKMAFDLWVDGQQLPRKMALKSAPGAKTPMSVTVVYRDYGQPVTISAPPASEVGEFGDLLQNVPSPGAS